MPLRNAARRRRRLGHGIAARAVKRTARTRRRWSWDHKHGLWKANPLADWTEKDVWRYILANDIPYHPLHDRGYESIGCEPCTVPAPGREGRWAGTDKLECGLHGD